MIDANPVNDSKSSELPFPDFEKPPVVEVAVSLQFKPLESLRTPHFGLIWNLLREERFSQVEDHGDIEPAFEEFETRPSPRLGVRVQAFDDAPPLPRVWLLNNERNELIQLQKDRLVVNWRQGVTEEPYPRYESLVPRGSPQSGHTGSLENRPTRKAQFRVPTPSGQATAPAPCVNR